MAVSSFVIVIVIISTADLHRHTDTPHSVTVSLFLRELVCNCLAINSKNRKPTACTYVGGNGGKTLDFALQKDDTNFSARTSRMSPLGGRLKRRGHQIIPLIDFNLLTKLQRTKANGAQTRRMVWPWNLYTTDYKKQKRITQAGICLWCRQVQNSPVGCVLYCWVR